MQFNARNKNVIKSSHNKSALIFFSLLCEDEMQWYMRIYILLIMMIHALATGQSSTWLNLSAGRRWLESLTAYAVSYPWESVWEGATSDLSRVVKCNGNIFHFAAYKYHHQSLAMPTHSHGKAIPTNCNQSKRQVRYETTKCNRPTTKEYKAVPSCLALNTPTAWHVLRLPGL